MPLDRLDVCVRFSVALSSSSRCLDCHCRVIGFSVRVCVFVRALIFCVRVVLFSFACFVYGDGGLRVASLVAFSAQLCLSNFGVVIVRLCFV